jgi:hypothetical protein
MRKAEYGRRRIRSVSLLADSIDFLEDASVNLLIVAALGMTPLQHRDPLVAKDAVKRRRPGDMARVSGPVERLWHEPRETS